VKFSVKLNHAAIGAFAKSAEMAAVMGELADKVAANVHSQGIKVGDRNGGPREIELPVKIVHGTTDRARATVILDHPAGIAVQAKHGALTKAASEAGLQVKGD